MKRRCYCIGCNKMTVQVAAAYDYTAPMGLKVWRCSSCGDAVEPVTDDELIDEIGSERKGEGIEVIY